jgi:hypothetical protein
VASGPRGKATRSERAREKPRGLSRAAESRNTLLAMATSGGSRRLQLLHLPRSPAGTAWWCPFIFATPLVQPLDASGPRLVAPRSGTSLNYNRRAGPTRPAPTSTWFQLSTAVPLLWPAECRDSAALTTRFGRACRPHKVRRGVPPAPRADGRAAVEICALMLWWHELTADTIAPVVAASGQNLRTCRRGRSERPNPVARADSVPSDCGFRREVRASRAYRTIFIALNVLAGRG